MDRHLEKVYGTHSVRAVMRTRPSDVARIFIADSNPGQPEKYARVTNDYLEMTRPAAVTPEVLGWNDFLRAAGLHREEGHQGICIFAQPRHIYSERELNLLAPGRLVVALDQVSNPQNLGMILRTAGFFAVDALLLLQNRAADITPEVVRIASGGAEFVKCYQVTNLSRALKDLKGLDYWVYGLDERGRETLAGTKFDRKTVIVIGAEGEGLRQKTKQHCDFLVSIPGGQEGIECLNAAVAASIAIAEISSRITA